MSEQIRKIAPAKAAGGPEKMAFASWTRDHNKLSFKSSAQPTTTSGRQFTVIDGTSTLTELQLESDAATGNADPFAPTDEAGKETSAYREVREGLAVRKARAISLTGSLTNGADAVAPAPLVDMKIDCWLVSRSKLR